MSSAPITLAEADARRRIALPGIDEPQASDLQALRRLGSEHVAWPEDAIVLSATALDVVRAMVKSVIRVLSFWDHRTRTRDLPHGAVSVDAAGCLRIRSLT